MIAGCKEVCNSHEFLRIHSSLPERRNNITVPTTTDALPPGDNHRVRLYPDFIRRSAGEAGDTSEFSGFGAFEAAVNHAIPVPRRAKMISLFMIPLSIWDQVVSDINRSGARSNGKEDRLISRP